MSTKVTQKLVFELSGDPSGVKNAFDKINREAKKTGEAIGVGVSAGAQKGTGALKRMAEIASGVIVSQLVNRGFGALKNEIGAAIRETAQLEYSVKKAAAVMGAGYDDLMAKARQVGAETAYTAQQAAGGLYMLASQGHDVKTALGEVQDIMMLAGATSSELGEAFKMSALQMRIFGVEADRAGDIADILATGMLKAAYVSLEDLNTSMRYASPTAAAFGYNLQQATASAMAFMNVIGQSSMAGTQFRMALMKLMSGSSKVQKVLDKYSITVKDVNDNARDFGEIIDDIAAKGVTPQEIVQMFGARASTGMLALVQGAKKGVNGYKLAMAELDKASGMSSNIYADMMDTMVGAGMRLKSQWSELRLTMMDFFGNLPKTFVGGIADAVQKINFAINSAQDAFSENMEYIKKFVTNTVDFLMTYIPSKVKSISASAMIFVTDFKGALIEIKSVIADVLDAPVFFMGDTAKRMKEEAQAGFIEVERERMKYEKRKATADAEIEAAKYKEYENYQGLYIGEIWSTVGGLLGDIVDDAKSKFERTKLNAMGVEKKEKGGKIAPVGGADPTTVAATAQAMLGEEMEDTAGDATTLGKTMGSLSASTKDASKALNAMIESLLPARMEKRKNSAERIKQIAEKKAERMLEEGTTTGTIDWGKSRREREKPSKQPEKDDYQLGYEERQRTKKEKEQQREKRRKKESEYRRAMGYTPDREVSDRDLEKFEKAKRKRLNEFFGEEISDEDYEGKVEQYKMLRGIGGVGNLEPYDIMKEPAEKIKEKRQPRPTKTPDSIYDIPGGLEVREGNNNKPIAPYTGGATRLPINFVAPTDPNDPNYNPYPNIAPNEQKYIDVPAGNQRFQREADKQNELAPKLEDLNKTSEDSGEVLLESVEKLETAFKTSKDNYDRQIKLTETHIQVTQTNIDTTALLSKRVKALESQISRLKSAVT